MIVFLIVIIMHSLPINIQANPMLNLDNENVTLELSFTPYASSYLKEQDGHLTQGPGWFSSYGIKNKNLRQLINPNLLGKASRKTVMQRLDQIRRHRFPDAPPLEKKVMSSHYGGWWAKSWWEGYCHRFAQSSLDQNVHEFVNATKGIICQDILLSEGEIKELFTAFYPDLIGHYYGKRNREEPPEDSSSGFVTSNPSWELNVQHINRSMLGVDDLPAHIFHQVVYERLDNNLGVILEASSSTRVENYPVYSANFNVQNLDLVGILDLNILRILPKGVFTSVRHDLEQLLKKVSLLENLLIDEALNQPQLTNDEFIDQNRDWLERVMHKVVIGFDHYDDGEIYFAQRSFNSYDFNVNFRETFVESKRVNFRNLIIDNLLYNLVRTRKIYLKSGIKIQKVTTTLKYRTYSTFNTPNDSTSNIEYKTYEYILIWQGSEIIDSRWLTSSADRPDFIWYSESFNWEVLASQPVDSYSRALYDLSTLIRTCITVNEIVEFFEFVSEFKQGSFNDQAGKKYYQQTLERLKNVINLNLITI